MTTLPQLPKFPTIDLSKIEMPKFDMPKFDMPKVEFPKVDFSGLDAAKFADKAGAALRDGAYVTIGIGVLGARRAAETAKHVAGLVRNAA